MDNARGRAVRAYNPGRAALLGAGAGLAGGIVFGMLMALMMPTMMPLIGKIIGQANVGGGWLYHIVNSAVIGALFGLVAGRLATSYGRGALVGAGYGMIWWVLGPLVLMPLLLGMPQMMFALDGNSILSLMGHVIFGGITGVGYVFLRERF